MKKCVHDRVIQVEGGLGAEINTGRCRDVGRNHVLQQDGELAVIVNGTIACIGKLRLDDPVRLGWCGGNDEIAGFFIVCLVREPACLAAWDRDAFDVRTGLLEEASRWDMVARRAGILAAVDAKFFSHARSGGPGVQGVNAVVRPLWVERLHSAMH